MKNRSLLMIPGPIEFEPAVLAAIGAPTTSHVAANFIEVFGQALERMRQVFLCAQGQPLVLAGSGTLAMDCAGSNLVEPGDRALCSTRVTLATVSLALLERYGAQVTQVRAPIGSDPDPVEVEHVLQASHYKLMTITHVDTSTGVIANVRALAALGQAHGALVVVDGVCSAPVKGSAWTIGGGPGVTASQKAIGVPPGLALLTIGPRASRALRPATRLCVTTMRIGPTGCPSCGHTRQDKAHISARPP